MNPGVPNSGASVFVILGFAILVATRVTDASEAEAHPGSTKAPRFSVAAVGDMIIQQPSIETIEARAPLIVRSIRNADVGYGNLESNSFILEKLNGPKTGPVEGPVLLSPPQVASELKALGFTFVSAANNHAGDWGSAGVLATAETLRAAGLAAAGTGVNLAAARAPAYVTVHHTRVALVAVTSSFLDGTQAGKDRPGVSALQVKASDAGGEMDAESRQGLLDSVSTASRNADLVLFSLHTHQPDLGNGRPPAFEVALAHAAIDNGAAAFFGHGPHELRGIEIYKNRPIFYSLGNFAVMLPPPALNPKPLVLPPGSVFTRRTFFESILAVSRYDRGQLAEIRLFPFELAEKGDLHTHGLPESVSPQAARDILLHLQALSQPFGTEIVIEGDTGVIRTTSHARN